MCLLSRFSALKKSIQTQVCHECVTSVSRVQPLMASQVCRELFELLGWLDNCETEEVSQLNCTIFDNWLTNYYNKVPDIHALRHVLHDICIREISDFSSTEEMISLWGFQHNSISVHQFKNPEFRQRFKQFLLTLETHHSDLFLHKTINSSVAVEDSEECSGFSLEIMQPVLSCTEQVAWRTGALKRLFIVMAAVYKTEPSLQLFIHQHLIQALKLTADELYRRITAQQSVMHAISTIAESHELEACTVALVTLMNAFYRQ